MRIIVLLTAGFIACLIAGFVLAACGSDGVDTQRPSPEPPMVPAGGATSVPEPDEELLARFNEAMAFARENELHTLTVGQVMQEMGEFYLGAPYIIGSLDVREEETLICRLDGFDCFTLVETLLSMAHGIVQEQYEYEPFAQRILYQRYREGAIDGYCSRLHYFTEWIRENEKRGALDNITEQLGGVQLEKDLSFMSEHRESYMQLADDHVYACIQEMESSLDDIEIHYIPQSRIREVYDELEASDNLAFATNREGLGVSHTGIVYDHDDGDRAIGALHASTSGGVKVSPDLQSYVQNVENQIGIIVARPLNPAYARN